MGLTKFSFTVITQEEFDDRRKATALAATTAVLPAKLPRKFSAPVGLVSKLKKETESLSCSNLASDCAFSDAQVTFPVFAMLRVRRAYNNSSYLSTFFISYAIVFAGIPFWHVVLEFFATFRFFSNQRIRL
jgi:hypothetical protein